MTRALVCIVAVAWLSHVRAQPPARTPLTRPLYSEIVDENSGLRPMESLSAPKKSEPLRFDAPTPFDLATLRLKRDGVRWQLWAGNQLVKDFGTAEADAHEALRLFRDLRLDSRGTVGGIFEYYLSEGKAPSSALHNKQVVPFEIGALRVEQMNGQWVLRDVRTILYNFGQSQSDARQALAICRQYGFNQIGVIGHPTPTIKYLLKDTNPAPTFGSAPPTLPASVQMQASEVARRQVFIPKVGPVGTLIPIEYRRLDLQRAGGEWVLVQGTAPLARFGPQEHEARRSMEVLQQFRCTELCRFGSTEFGFYLTNGRPPQGSLIGFQSNLLRLDKLNVRKTLEGWTICEDNRPLFKFGDEETAARQALAAIQHFQFDTYSLVGAGHLGESYLFVRTR